MGTATRPAWPISIARRFVEQHGNELTCMRLKLWRNRAVKLARDVAALAATTHKSRRRKRVCDLDANLATATNCELAHELLRQIRWVRDQLLTFCDFPGKIDATNNVNWRALRPCVIQRKVKNCYRARWAAEADQRKAVDTDRLLGASPFNTVLGTISD